MPQIVPQISGQKAPARVPHQLRQLARDLVESLGQRLDRLSNVLIALVPVGLHAARVKPSPARAGKGS